MVSLPQAENGDRGHGREGHGHDHDRVSGGCGTSCGAGLEKVYPSTAVRYSAMSWIGEFQYRPGTVFKCGAKVVIQTERGIELGTQVSLTCHGCDKSVSREQINRYVEASGPDYYRLGSGRILREATPEDLAEHEHLNLRAKQESDDCALLAAQLELDMKIVTVEHLLGGERVVYYFMAEGRVDFRQLVRELAARHQTRIEMRQVGARDEARLVADYEICGRECCCKNFLKTLRPVKMHMAKVQKATLDLSKVSGRCGRLRCCLRYEHEGYEALAAKLPRIGSRIRTEHGDGFVVDRQILTQLVMFRTEEDKLVTVPLESVKEVFAPPAGRRQRDEDGGFDGDEDDGGGGRDRDAGDDGGFDGPRDGGRGRERGRSGGRGGERGREARRGGRSGPDGGQRDDRGRDEGRPFDGRRDDRGPDMRGEEGRGPARRGDDRRDREEPREDGGRREDGPDDRRDDRRPQGRESPHESGEDRPPDRVTDQSEPSAEPPERRMDVPHEEPSDGPANPPTAHPPADSDGGGSSGEQGDGSDSQDGRPGGPRRPFGHRGRRRGGRGRFRGGGGSGPEQPGRGH